MSPFVTLSAIRAATRMGQKTVSNLVNRPYPLQFTLAKTGPQGGNPTRLYRVVDLIPRLRSMRRITESMIATLLSEVAI